MGDSPAPPAQPAVPKAPNYAEASREGIQAQVEALPQIYETQLEYGPKFLDLKLADIERSGMANAASALAVEQQYGEEFVKNRLKLVEMSDPVGSSLRKELGLRMMEEVKLGTELGDELKHDVIQTFRAGRDARGGGFGDEDAILEAMTVGSAGLGIQNERQRMAMSFLGLPTPSSEFAPVAGARTGAAPYNPLVADPTIDPTAGRFAAQFALQGYGDQLQYNQGMYNQQVNWGLNAPNPWMEGLGLAVGAGTQLGAAALRYS